MKQRYQKQNHGHFTVFDSLSIEFGESNKISVKIDKMGMILENKWKLMPLYSDPSVS